MNDSPEQLPVKSGALSSWKTVLSGLVLLAAVLAFLAVAGMALLRFFVVPHIPDYKPEIEAQASKRLGTPVKIGSLKVGWADWNPVIDAGDVKVHNREGVVALALAQVHTQISWKSLFQGSLVFERLELGAPDLMIKRLKDGKLQVAGLEIDPFAKSNDDSLNRWLVEQPRIIIRNGVLRWIDEQRNAPVATLKNANLDLSNNGWQHGLKISGDLTTATDTDGVPASLEATASFKHPVGTALTSNKADMSKWAGEVYASLSRASLTEIRRYVDIPFAIERGDGSVRGWLNIDQGEVTQATADVALDKVKAQLAKDAPWLDLARLSGRLIAKPNVLAAGGIDMAAEQLTWQEVGRKALPPANLALVVENKKDAEKGKGKFTASLLDLGELQHLASFIKLPKGMNEALAKHAPRGALSEVQASWLGQADAPREFDIKTKLADFSLEAVAATPLPGPQRAAPELNPGTPGFKGVSGTLQATQKSGEADLRIERGSLQLPGVMDPEVIALDKVKAQVNWVQEQASVKDGKETKNVPVWRVNISVPELMNAHASGNAKATWRQDPADVLAQQKAAANGKAAAGYLDHAHPGWLELQGTLTRADAKAVWRYLPISLPPSVRTYLQNSILQGTARNTQFTVNGDLYHFPFAPEFSERDKNLVPQVAPSKLLAAKDWRGVASKDSEVFRIVTQVEDLTLDYVPTSTDAEGKAVPGWPAIRNLSGELSFDRVSMNIRDARGVITPGNAGTVNLSKVNGRIPDFRQRTTLELQGATQGALQDYLAFVRNTPINTWTAKVLEQARATGDTQLDLKIALPFAEMKNSTVEGKLALNGNDLSITPFIPRFTQANGMVTFTEKGFSVKPMKANLLGGQATIEGGTQEDRSTVFTATGTVTAEALKNEATLGALTVIAGRASGQAPYDAKVLIRAGQPEITVNTPLTGMALDFPAPLGKTADSSLQVRYSTQLQGKIEQAANKPDGLRDMLNVTIGPSIAIQYEREIKTTPKGVELKVLRGGIGVNNPAILPDMGVFANVKMPRFDVDAWVVALKRLPSPAPATPAMLDASAPTNNAEAPSPTAAAEPMTTNDVLQNPYVPNVLAMQVDEVMFGKKLWSNIVAGASFRDGEVQANVDSTPFSGYIAWRAGGVAGGLGKVTARLGRLSVPKESRDIEQLLDEPADQLPAVDLVVEEFELGGKNLGRLELEALNVAGRNREWQLRRLEVSNAESTLRANGNWVPVVATTAFAGPSLKAAITPSKRVNMNFTLDIKDSGALLTRFGIPQTIRDGAGRIEGKLNWTGSPTALDFPTLGGQLNMKMERGQFLKQDPGIARLLGVLSLQNLPRRISLDFRDVFSKGFVFDEVTAEAVVERGIARTNNFRMKGTQANVLMEGSADISKETQNLYVIVEPDINLGAASLAYIAINPAIGLSTFFLQWLARSSLNKALAFEYRVTGPWVSPKVEKVDSRSKVKPAENAPVEVGEAAPTKLAPVTQ